MKYEVRVHFDIYSTSIVHNGDLTITVEANDSVAAMEKLGAAMQRALGDESISVKVTGKGSR